MTFIPGSNEPSRLSTVSNPSKCAKLPGLAPPVAPVPDGSGEISCKWVDHRCEPPLNVVKYASMPGVRRPTSASVILAMTRIVVRSPIRRTTGVTWVALSV